MFENLTNKFEEIFSSLKKAPSLNEAQVDEGLRSIRQALLEADVSLEVAKDFVEKVKPKALGKEIIRSTSPGQMVVKIVYDELVNLLGQKNIEINLNSVPPVSVMMVGLQGSGKTTSTAKLASYLEKNNKKKVMMVSLDVYRPAAQEQLKILGGEPTLHNELDNIIDYIKSSKIADKLTLITNGLNLTDKIIESLSKLDSLVISEYPIPNVLSIEKVFNISQVKTKLTSNGVDVIFWRQDEFELYGVEQQGIEYNSELNWKRCFQKDSCRVINLDGIYRCTVTYSEKKNLCGWNLRKDIIDFIESDVPLSHCKVCPTPPARMKWDSTKLKTDLKNYSRGINLIQNWSQNDK